MNNGIIDIELWRFIAAYAFILLLLFIVKIRGISRERQIIIASVRMTVQLIIAGYILTLIFDHPSPWLTLLIIFVMESFAIRNVYEQVKFKLSTPLKGTVAIAMVGGTLVSLFYFNLVVIHFAPWYEPRYFIPIAGMIVGNSMTGITLGLNTLIGALKDQRDVVEGALMLGATPKAATKKFVDDAFDAAILPTLNNMIGMGIIFLPGMMTGQILSGVSPLVAIEYQIAILLGIIGSVALTVILFIYIGYQFLFTKHAQLNSL
ncbi:iron export ABC transporter permease subunit FetB [Rossellomorea aquimaris]|uniref:ABC transporter permease n=1 Tax=Rossellomorea aquimaris TaxID=189382 RepID=UPI001CD3BDD5|nr:iron export ABC transporter permease subunit FetB [Rossellomorea aquimaris]MCA1056633.1 iron export ABC transporter permease subunit FetB [Rossellomorea aquimaris]